MMMLFKSFLPGSIPFLLLVFLIGLLLLNMQRSRRLGLYWLWVLFLFCLVFSMPVVSRLLAAPLSWGFAPLQAENRISRVDAVVVLDGGTLHYEDDERLLEVPNEGCARRALEAARIYHLFGNPLVIVSGGRYSGGRRWGAEASALCDSIIKLGVPSDRIILDSSSVNTRAHAMNLVHILREKGVSSFVLVTSPTHIRRSVLAFRAVGLDPIPSPSTSIIDSMRGMKGFFPSPTAILHIQEAMHDYFGLAYYFLKGFFYKN